MGMEIVGKPFAPKEVVEFAFQIARGLHYLARQEPPIIHRDLKVRQLSLIQLRISLIFPLPPPLSRFAATER